MSEARRSSTDEVFTGLRDRIVTGALAPGTSHSVYRMADELGISRTPVREAVLRLADLGLVTIERNRGFTVRGVQAQDIRDVFELRVLLEVPAARHAARRSDPELVTGLNATLAAMRDAAGRDDEVAFMQHDRALHDLVGATMGNRRLTEEVDRLRDLIQVRGASTVDRTRTMGDIADEHAPIVEAIAAGDPEAAADAMRAHLDHTAALLVQQLATPEGGE